MRLLSILLCIALCHANYVKSFEFDPAIALIMLQFLVHAQETTTGNQTSAENEVNCGEISQLKKTIEHQQQQINILSEMIFDLQKYIEEQIQRIDEIEDDMEDEAVMKEQEAALLSQLEQQARQMCNGA